MSNTFFPNQIQIVTQILLTLYNIKGEGNSKTSHKFSYTNKCHYVYFFFLVLTGYR